MCFKARDEARRGWVCYVPHFNGFGAKKTIKIVHIFDLGQLASHAIALGTRLLRCALRKCSFVLYGRCIKQPGLKLSMTSAIHRSKKGIWRVRELYTWPHHQYILQQYGGNPLLRQDHFLPESMLSTPPSQHTSVVKQNKKDILVARGVVRGL